MFNPVATYRIQFHKYFTLTHVERILPYLKKLGIKTLYASPIFTAVPGSTHGYDGLNPHGINPEIGTPEQLQQVRQQLTEAGINWIQDIVPNHMAFHPGNTWLMDVLEKGRQSEYATYFDISWTSPVYQGRLMVPFLGDTLQKVIGNKELQLAYKYNRLQLCYYDSCYPVNARAYMSVLQEEEIKAPEAVIQLRQQLEALHSVEEPMAFSKSWEEILLQLSSLYKNEVVKNYIDDQLKSINENKEQLTQIAEGQNYRLCHWQETDTQINFRRFFTVNGLICMNIQDAEVFNSYHQFIQTLVEDGTFQGLRVDHIDGLYDPTGYLEQLRNLTGEETYLIVEKILEPGESLTSHWPIQGNTGYDFLSDVNNLFTNKNSEERFTQFYQHLVNNATSIPHQVYQKKEYILHNHMSGELDNLFALFLQLNLVEKKALAGIHHEDLKEAIAEFLIQCPVYRFYGNSLPLDKEETNALAGIFERMRKTTKPAVVNLLQKILLHQPQEGDRERNKRTLQFYQRCMQFTGPLMAKGVEDTLMYTNNRFIGHNEVGDSPEAFGHTVEQFHSLMQARQQQWPLTLNTTSTHDTKRGEDVRARLNVLTDLVQDWLQQVTEWQILTQPLKTNGAPDANDEYFIYQTIAGAYPMPGEEEDAFTERLQEYLQKALREAKLNSNWTSPNETYESATKKFAVSLLQKDGTFWKSFAPFHQKIADFGIINSLSQLILKFTCPGVPDVYQGGELWDLSLVDPDNRRPVDYEKRTRLLAELKAIDDDAERLQALWNARYSGSIKLWLTQQLYALRGNQAELFAQGAYIPLRVEGAYKENVLAFARKYKQYYVLVAVPLHLAALCQQQDATLQTVDWKDTHLLLPEEITGTLDVLWTSEKVDAGSKLLLSNLFNTLPFALLQAQGQDKERGAGLLLHISSLPSPFGIGDLGPEAYSFANFLYNSHQKYWQLLPLNPTEAGQGHSPYSSTSSRAGNILFISPELLVKEGLLSKEDVVSIQKAPVSLVNYTEAEDIKNTLFEKAWHNYKGGKGAHLKQAFDAFCVAQNEWLHDFALFTFLKNREGGKAWFQWDMQLAKREPDALQKVEHDAGDKLDKIKWLQFLFAQQWHALKEYCNNKSIQLIGDMPFYVSYDSADVWANTALFAIDEDGNQTGVAGTPPDAFSADGQLWGMPVFNWDALKEQGYTWWIERLRKNGELFDLIRLDHFRAFADYWEVPAGETTAKKGSWKPGPGAGFFEAIKAALGELPFIAEDLGDINEDVLNLRDAYAMPGMNVLQFAFGADMAQSPYIPHNYIHNSIVYTGTHDNNTTRGWYRQEADDGTRNRLSEYVGRHVLEEEAHLALGQLAYASIAKVAILPVQDVLGLDESARINIPASGEANWQWRLLPGQLNHGAQQLLKWWARIYNRD